MSDVTQELDTSGLTCPMPILRIKKALNQLQSGDVLRVMASDPGSVSDVEAFAKQTGNELLESTTENDTFIFRLKKA